ncbi:mutS protein homolog 4-like [Condylostylus longicornis]|uniref:mutS protein homolog 4-like n=1 Tax=Condylostylus longicornis TaxID=2530218 RepID=UPI00244E2CB6|nr:mutS protein homolog 4-like [Condylostylus longicornis]
MFLAFCEGSGNSVGEIGLASIDLGSPILYLSQFNDDLLYTSLITKLQIHTPTEAINSITFMTNSLKIKFDGKFGRMVLDYNTYNRLEILQPIFKARQNKACLLDILDKTVTQIGKRQIRAKILEPYLELKDIVFVQEAIKDLLTKSKNENFIALNDREEKDIIKSVQTMLDRILLIKTQFELVPELHKVLKPFKSYILYKAYTNLMDERFAHILNIIDKVLRPETRFIRGTGQIFQRIHAIRSGLNDYLDILRETYNNLTDSINENINQLSEQYALPLRMTYSASKGFHIQLLKPKNRGEKIEIPIGLTLIYEKSNAMYLTTNEIIKSNFKLRETANEIYVCCEKIIKKLTEDLIQYSEVNFLLVDLIANLDIILSYTKVSQMDGFCCPEFGEETRVIDACHIFLENSKSSKICVPNNIIGTPEYNVYVITGPNMAGKTVYLKTIAIIQIIAQLGCYVPAKKAKFKICDKIFTRLGFDDRIEQNGSGFINEIREIEYIFNNITSRSLIIIDELCRTTNPVGGFNLAWKICSKLCQVEQILETNYKVYEQKKGYTVDTNDEDSEIKGFTLQNIEIFRLPMPHIYIATHFLRLTELKEKFFNVVNLHVEAEEIINGENLSLKYTHKVKEGVTTIKNYGLKLAKRVGIPDEIIKNAYDILNDIRMNSTKNENNASANHNETIDEIDILKKTLDNLFPNKSFQIPKKPDSFMSIANFMNNSDLGPVKLHKNTKLNVSSNDLMKDFSFKMYDFYADIMTLQRHTPSYSSEEFQKKAKEMFEIVKESLPVELQNLLATKDMSSILEESRNENVNTSMKLNEDKFLFENNLESFQNETNNLFGLKDNEKFSFHTTKNQQDTTSNEIVNESELKSLFEKENKNKIKIIQNLQIVPPQNKFKNKMNNQIVDYENELFKNSKQLSNSFDFGLLKDCGIDFSSTKNSPESSQKYSEVKREDSESTAVRLNQTIDLGILRNFNKTKN